MAVTLLHGVVASADPAGLMVDRTLMVQPLFEAYLSSRAPFGAWGEHPDDGVDVLTVDDATRAGAEACRIAVRLGHAVTFFVNPQNIVTGEPYFFSVLSAAIDATRRVEVVYRDTVYRLADRAARLAFRLAVKNVLLWCPGDEERDAELARVLDLLETGAVAVPDHLLPITAAELCELRDIGVRIENHGWDHVEIGRLSEEGFVEHVARGREWLRSNIGVPARSYAPPFGKTFVPSFQRHVEGTWFLAAGEMPAGQLAERCWNRVAVPGAM